MTGAVRELEGEALEDWDAAAVHAAGGHVLQSRAWAEHRAASGWRPRFLAVGDVRALVLERSWPWLGGGSAYLPRGPVGPGRGWDVPAGRAQPGRAADQGASAAVGTALVAISEHLAERGVDVIAGDPEVTGYAGYRNAMLAGGFHAIPEIQPSRHRMAIAFPSAGVDPDAVFGAFEKGTRQRIRRAERDRVVVLRWDAADAELEGTQRAAEDAGAALDRFYGLLRDTGDRRGFGLGGPRTFVPWWQRALAAGYLVYLEAREGAADGDVLGGLVLYRHGTRLSTAHSGDRAERRRDHPGAMHLLRWRAIQLALAEGRDEMDLGGADVAGARRIPRKGEPTYGLYAHKRSFGADWVTLTGAQERVVRRWRYAAGRAAAKAARVVGRGGGGSGA